MTALTKARTLLHALAATGAGSHIVTVAFRRAIEREDFGALHAMRPDVVALCHAVLDDSRGDRMLRAYLDALGPSRMHGMQWGPADGESDGVPF
jgi:hypothetical protein